MMLLDLRDFKAVIATASVLLTVVLAAPVCSGTPGVSRTVLAAVPSKYRARVRESLDLAGMNRAEIEKAIASLSPEHREALCFIIACMPPVDLASAKSEDLIEDVELSYKTRDFFPWTKEIPEDVFLHYVLPYRVTQEPMESWRPYFLRELTPIVQGETSIERAAVAVNKWCGGKVRFCQTQWRDQGPFETLKAGYGRCEEMTIFFICALRSVGIPARIASTPHWAAMDNNHAWTEVWTERGWKFAGACEPADSLDLAWFKDTVRRAAAVYSLVYGIPDDTTQLYKKGQDFALINSTLVYSDTGMIGLKLMDRGRPAAGEPVCISVFNYGALRTVASLKTDKNGEARATVGDGTYFVSAGSEKASWTLIRVEPNKKCEVTMDLSRPMGFDSEFYLRLPVRESAK